MGCDIHIRTEYQRVFSNTPEQIKTELAKFQHHWLPADPLFYDPWFNDGNVSNNQIDLVPVELDIGRDYTLFAQLANVRNRDIDYILKNETDPNALPFIAAPKGMPDDAAKSTVAASDEWGEDGHSHSYFTLAELLSWYNDHHEIDYHGMVSPEAAQALDENGTVPTNWCDFTSNETWVHRVWTNDNSSLKLLIDKLLERLELTRQTRLYYDHVQSPDKYQVQPADVFLRVVFWFDN